MPKIIIHGASGWLGHSTIHALNTLYGFENLELLLLGSKSRTVEFSGFGKLQIRNVKDAIEQESFSESPDFYFQLGFKTRDYDKKLGEKEYINQNFSILELSEELIRKSKPKSIGLISSGVVTQFFDPKSKYLGDNYTYLKIKEELILSKLSKEINASLSTIRLWGSTGEFMLEPLKYAIGDLIHQALYSSNIHIKSSHRVYRRYCDSVELIMVLINLMSNKLNLTINSGGTLVEIEELAQEILTALDVKKPIIRNLNSSLEADYYYSNEDYFEDYALKYGVNLSNLTSQIIKTSKSVKISNRLTPKTNT